MMNADEYSGHKGNSVAPSTLDLSAATRIQLNIATAMAYINHQGGTIIHAGQTEAGLTLTWTEGHIPDMTPIHFPGVENW